MSVPENIFQLGPSMLGWDITCSCVPLSYPISSLHPQHTSAMAPEEKQDLSKLDTAARERIAQQVGCTTADIDDLVQRFTMMKRLFSGLAEDARQGRPMPTTPEEMVQRFGTRWFCNK